MDVTRGGRLGGYEVVSAIGAGGMGEVFRARDPRLGRDVALKLLPADIANDPERLARFRREAQVLASLNHPHVGAIHGLEESNGTPFLVLELVEGEDLAARLARGPIPLDEALAIALQIADALEAAHEKGIVHRDLKPANVKVTPEGVVKLLDFGLAKASSTSVASSEISLSPTLTAHGTQAGMILGTAAYMSPEQARGRPVDKRADVWAFGVVLYEMLTGTRLFAGETVSDVLASVLKNEPDWSALGEDVPPRVRRVLVRCLQKDPRQRLHDIGDARLELLEKEAAPLPSPAALPRKRRLSRAALWLIALAAVGTAVDIGLALASARKEPRRAMPLRVSVLPPAGTLSSGPIELSPDGTKLAFTAAAADGKTLLYWRSLDALDAKPLNGTEGAEAPFWSPDGVSIGFFAGKKLKRIAIAGGPPRELAGATDQRGGSWGSRGFIVYAPEGGGPIYKVAADGGTPAPVTKLEREETSHRWPHFLADGERFLFLSRKPKPPSRLLLEAASIGGGKRTAITEAHTSGVVHAGRVFFGLESSLLSQQLDEPSLTLSGEPRVVTEDFWSSPTAMDGLTAFSVANDGTFAYRRGGIARFQLVFRDREGKKLGTVGTPTFSSGPRLSADLRRVFFDVVETVKNSTAVVSIDTETGRQTRLTFGTGNDTSPLASPDGRTIVFSSDARGPFDIYSVDATGNTVAPLLSNESWKH
ncbi:MAG TPA: protein kinase, partial [Thermoanaerobaculia bacterium]|nr:protein kinase [Thermoanaerobaculia bacterium]